MAKVSVPACGSIGVIKDIGAAELAPAAWTDASNIRFLDGAAYQFLGHGTVYDGGAYAPQFVQPMYVAGARYWLYATATKQFAVSNATGNTVHTDITHATARSGGVNQWTGTILGGIPVLNAGDGKAPMYWDQDLTHKFLDIPAWPLNTSARVVRAFKNMLIALNVTKAGVNLPFMVKWSNNAVPGSLPATWDENDKTEDAGEFDLGEGQDPIIDGIGLKESLIVYKESSTYAIDYVGGAFILRPRKVFGMSGLLNKNCAVDVDSFHFAVTGSDIVIHDGYSATSILDKRARRYFFQNLDTASRGQVFCFLNPFLNEIYVAYPSIGATSCDTALVYNFVDKTVSFRTLPNVSHADFGPVDGALGGNWSQDSDAWDSDLTAWNGPDFTPDTVRVIMASADMKLFMLDAAASFDGALPIAHLERRGVDFGEPEYYKLVTSIRPRISGNVGETVIVKVGFSDDPFADPVYTSTEFVIGVDTQVDVFVSGRYMAVRFETGTAFQWRLDSYDWFVEKEGMY